MRGWWSTVVFILVQSVKHKKFVTFFTSFLHQNVCRCVRPVSVASHTWRCTCALTLVSDRTSVRFVRSGSPRRVALTLTSVFIQASDPILVTFATKGMFKQCIFFQLYVQYKELYLYLYLQNLSILLYASVHKMLVNKEIHDYHTI